MRARSQKGIFARPINSGWPQANKVKKTSARLWLWLLIAYQLIWRVKIFQDFTGVENKVRLGWFYISSIWTLLVKSYGNKWLEPTARLIESQLLFLIYDEPS